MREIRPAGYADCAWGSGAATLRTRELSRNLTYPARALYVDQTLPREDAVARSALN